MLDTAGEVLYSPPMHFFSTADLPANSPRKFDLADGYTHVAHHDIRIRLLRHNPEREPLDDLTRAVWNAARWTDVYAPTT